MSAWIKMISDDEATPHLKKVLKTAQTPHGTVDNVMRVHSLRPSTMEGHLTYIGQFFMIKTIPYQLGFKKLLVVMFLF